VGLCDGNLVKNMLQALKNFQSYKMVAHCRNPDSKPCISTDEERQNAPEVNKRTLYRWIAGTHESRVISHQEQQRLTPAEESAIVKWCEEQDDRGFPPRLDMVRIMAIHLEEKRTRIIAAPLGQKWISRFLNRHPTLASKLSCNLERQRAYANNP